MGYGANEARWVDMVCRGVFQVIVGMVGIVSAGV